jgi:hypothetical protein
MEPNYYSEGETRAYLSPDQIKASWYQGDHRGARRDCLNEAFRLYYIYRNRIEQVARRHWDTYWAMLRELEDAGDAGWGPGVSDLDDASRAPDRPKRPLDGRGGEGVLGIEQTQCVRKRGPRRAACGRKFLERPQSQAKKTRRIADRIPTDSAVAGGRPGKGEEALQDHQGRRSLWRGSAPWTLTSRRAESGWYEQMLPWLDNFNSAMEVIEVLREADLIRTLHR